MHVRISLQSANYCLNIAKNGKFFFPMRFPSSLNTNTCNSSSRIFQGVLCGGANDQERKRNHLAFVSVSIGVKHPDLHILLPNFLNLRGSF